MGGRETVLAGSCKRTHDRHSPAIPPNLIQSAMFRTLPTAHRSANALYRSTDAPRVSLSAPILSFDGPIDAGMHELARQRPLVSGDTVNRCARAGPLAPSDRLRRSLPHIGMSVASRDDASSRSTLYIVASPRGGCRCRLAVLVENGWLTRLEHECI